jgi:tetrahydromethanopterin S-methyltransferase subunit B
MSETNVKTIRKQIRNVFQELAPGIITQELYKDLQRGLSIELNAKVDKIETLVKETLNKMDTRAKAIQGFLVQEVQFKIANQIHNQHVTMIAWQELMAEKVGDVQEFNKKLDAKKQEIQARLDAESLAQQQAAIKGSEPATETAQG